MHKARAWIHEDGKTLSLAADKVFKKEGQWTPLYDFDTFTNMEKALAASQRQVEKLSVYEGMYSLAQKDIAQLQARLAGAEGLIRNFAETSMCGGYSANYMRAKSAEYIANLSPAATSAKPQEAES